MIAMTKHHIVRFQQIIVTTEVHFVSIFVFFARNVYATRHEINETQRVVRITFHDLAAPKSQISLLVP
jgi:hypothetical protein